ncbi:hypothetical protein TYRP_011679 [Tyrophagus putrescentiae]|nr:hypothetical protein TYRP_011679 [Tyrophagus putrescentiae]
MFRRNSLRKADSPSSTLVATGNYVLMLMVMGPLSFLAEVLIAVGVAAVGTSTRISSTVVCVVEGTASKVGGGGGGGGVRGRRPVRSHQRPHPPVVVDADVGGVTGLAGGAHAGARLRDQRVAVGEEAT